MEQSKIIDTTETYQKPMGRINDVLIVTNRNYVPVDFIVLDTTRKRPVSGAPIFAINGAL